MDEILVFLVEAFLWFIFFKVLFAFIGIWVSNKTMKEEREELKDELAKMIHYINQEKHGDCYYWFDKETDQFLAQGENDDEIKQHLQQRFKGHIFVLDGKRAMYGPKLEIVSLDQLPTLFNASTKTS